MWTLSTIKCLKKRILRIGNHQEVTYGENLKGLKKLGSKIICKNFKKDLECFRSL